MPTPPMLRRRDPVDASRREGPDPLGSITVFLLALIALALFVAGILAVYTYATPGVEAPFVIAITIAFACVLGIHVVGRALRRLRASR